MKSMNVEGLVVFFIWFLSSPTYAMNNSSSYTKHETENRGQRIKEDTIETMISCSYVSGNTDFDFSSINRKLLLGKIIERQKMVEKTNKEVECPDRDNDLINLHNTVSLLDRQQSNQCSLTLWQWLYSCLPFTTMSVVDSLPIGRWQLLHELLERDDVRKKTPTKETLKTFFENAVLNNGTNNAEEISYTWFKDTVLELPETYCNGIIKGVYTEQLNLIDVSPQKDKDILPRTQYWQQQYTTQISADGACADVELPGVYFPFDATEEHFVGFAHNKVFVFVLPKAMRQRMKFVVIRGEDRLNEIVRVDVQGCSKDTIGKPSFTIDTEGLTALAACQITCEFVYSEYSKIFNQSRITVRAMDAKKKPWMGDMPGKVERIIQLAYNTFICLDSEGKLHRITRHVGDKKLKVNHIVSDSIFDTIAVDKKTRLCALTKRYTSQDTDYPYWKKIIFDHNVYTLDKQNLQTVDTLDDSMFEVIKASDPYGLNANDYAGAASLMPILQCHEGAVLAWYPKCVTLSGQCSRSGLYKLASWAGQYRCVKSFKTKCRDD